MEETHTGSSVTATGLFGTPGTPFLQQRGCQLFVLTFLHFLVDFYGGLRTPLAQPTLMEHLMVSFGAVTILISSSSLLANAVQPISGWLLPKRGFPALLLLCPVVASVMTLIGLTASYIGVGALMLFSAIGIGLLHPEGMLAAHSISGRHQGLGLAFYLSGGFFGYSLASWVSANWATRWGLNMFYLLAIPVLLAVFLTLATRLHRLHGHSVTATPEGIRHRISFPWVFLLTVLIAIGVTNLCYYITPYMVRSFGRAFQADGGKAIFYFGITGALGSYLWGYLSERFKRCRLIAGCLIISVPLLLLLLQTDDPRLIIALCALSGFFLGAIFPLSVVLGRGAAGGSPRLRAGLLIGGSWGMGALFVMAAGMWISRFPDDDPEPVRSVLALTILFMAAGILIALGLDSRERKSV